jgi:cell division protein FtsB
MNKNHNKLEKLKTEKRYFEEKIETDRQKIEELQTSSENLEKFAREQFKMKKENEDIFVIIEK